jgi:hypothetical protein
MLLVHDLEVDMFLQGAAAAAPISVIDDNKDTLIQILKAKGANKLYGKNCPTQIAEKLSKKCVERWIRNYHAYFKKCEVADNLGNIEEIRFPEVWQELGDYGMSKDQLQQVQRSMTRDNSTPNERYTPFAFNLNSFKTWMIDAVVDKDDVWKKLEKIKSNKSARNKCLTNQFEECLEEAEDLFNEKSDR